MLSYTATQYLVVLAITDFESIHGDNIFVEVDVGWGNENTQNGKLHLRIFSG